MEQLTTAVNSFLKDICTEFSCKVPSYTNEVLLSEVKTLVDSSGNEIFLGLNIKDMYAKGDRHIRECLDKHLKNIKILYALVGNKSLVKSSDKLNKLNDVLPIEKCIDIMKKNGLITKIVEINNSTPDDKKKLYTLLKEIVNCKEFELTINDLQDLLSNLNFLSLTLNLLPLLQSHNIFESLFSLYNEDFIGELTK